MREVVMMPRTIIIIELLSVNSLLVYVYTAKNIIHVKKITGEPVDLRSNCKAFFGNWYLSQNVRLKWI